jgi:hypothetical protein
VRAVCAVMCLARRHPPVHHTALEPQSQSHSDGPRAAGRHKYPPAPRVHLPLLSFPLCGSARGGGCSLRRALRQRNRLASRRPHQPVPPSRTHRPPPGRGRSLQPPPPAFLLSLYIQSGTRTERKPRPRTPRLLACLPVPPWPPLTPLGFSPPRAACRFGRT